jgi:hypothetical protein
LNFASPAGVMLCRIIRNSSTTFLLESIQLNKSFSRNLSPPVAVFCSSVGL